MRECTLYSILITEQVHGLHWLLKINVNIQKFLLTLHITFSYQRNELLIYKAQAIYSLQDKEFQLI
jgi:hypothetical protein